MTSDTELRFATSVSAETIRRYLLVNGWNRHEHIRPSLDLFTKHTPDLGNLELLLPRDEHRSDSTRRKADALRIISQCENVELSKAVKAIRSVGFDVWRTIVPDESVRQESINLSIAAKFISNAHDLLASSATTETNQRPFFGRVTKAAAAFADECRFAHTFRGSFGFTIEAPISANLSPTIPIIEERAPFERRVLERLARGITNIEVAGLERDTSPITENFATGFSANMCEDFVDLMNAAQGETLAFEFAFSPEWRPSFDVKANIEVTLSPVHAEIAQDAARKLRLQDFERNQTVIGRVVRLQSQSDPSNLFDDGGDREISIYWDSSTFGAISVRVALPATQYLAANEAHGKGRYVAVSGLIDRQGRNWVLLEPRDFAVLA